MENSFPIMGKTRAWTVRMQLTDSSQLLSAAVDAALGEVVYWQGVRAAMITCETYDCRISFGAAATTSIGHILYVGQSIRVPSNDMVSGAHLINKTAGQNAIIQVTLEY